MMADWKQPNCRLRLMLRYPLEKLCYRPVNPECFQKSTCESRSCGRLSTPGAATADEIPPVYTQRGRET